MQLISPDASSKKTEKILYQGAGNQLMNEPKNETPNVPVQATQSPAGKAQKVRSSRYEWESKSNNENEKAVGASGASRRSLLASARAMLRKFFSGDRGFFDNDDDASPSAA
ncbi:MAG: hypothetical protein WA672_20650 [Candidatus Angelobacter sp.]